jgi:hypothetical protein
MEEYAMNDDLMIHNPMNADTSRELQRRICHVLGISPEDLALLRALSDRMVRVENGCTTVTRRCDDLQNVLRQACCPANMLYSQITINENSHKDQVNIVTPVTGLGDPYVDDFPIPPKKKIRLVQEERPGYSPVDITVALNLANNGTNFLDIVVRFYVSTKPTGPGTQVGSEYRGFQFFSNDGLVTPIKFPALSKLPRHGGLEGVSHHRDRARRHRQQFNQRVRQRAGQQRRLVRRLRTRRLPLRGQRHGIGTDHLLAAQRGRFQRPDAD